MSESEGQYGVAVAHGCDTGQQELVLPPLFERVRVAHRLDVGGRDEHLRIADPEEFDSRLRKDVTTTLRLIVSYPRDAHRRGRPL